MVRFFFDWIHGGRTDAPYSLSLVKTFIKNGFWPWIIRGVPKEVKWSPALVQDFYFHWIFTGSEKLFILFIFYLMEIIYLSDGNYLYLSGKVKC